MDLDLFHGDLPVASGDNATVYVGAPEACDLCQSPFAGDMVDGRTRAGPWACMCLPCHAAHGVGLGTGYGQRYRTAASGKHSGRFVKVEG